MAGTPLSPEPPRTPILFPWQPTFIGVDKLERCLDVRSIRHPCFFFAAFQYFGDFIVPPALAHKLVPDVKIVLRGSLPIFKAPLQDFLVGPTAIHALD